MEDKLCCPFLSLLPPLPPVPPPHRKKKGKTHPTKPCLYGLSKKRSATASSTQHVPHTLNQFWSSLTTPAQWERPIENQDYFRSSEMEGGPILMNLPCYQPLPHGWASTAQVFGSCLNYTEPLKFEM